MIKITKNLKNHPILRFALHILILVCFFSINDTLKIVFYLHLNTNYFFLCI